MSKLKKIRNWAIHKLGGYVDTDQILHVGTVKYVPVQCKPVVLGAKVCLDRRAFENAWNAGAMTTYPANAARKRLREELAEKIMEFTTVRFKDDPKTGQLVFFGELCVVKPEDAGRFIYHEEDMG